MVKMDLLGRRQLVDIGKTFLKQSVNLWTGKFVNVNVNVDVHVAYGANVCSCAPTRAITFLFIADSRPELVTNQSRNR